MNNILEGYSLCQHGGTVDVFSCIGEIGNDYILQGYYCGDLISVEGGTVREEVTKAG